MTGTTKPPILIVDDEPEILFSLKAMLRTEFTVYTAESGVAALKILEQHPIHAIMSDQRMPEMTGTELLQRSQGICPEAVRIIFTGYADIKSVVEAINQGRIYRYLTKPWDPDELIEVLHDACREHDQIAERQSLLCELRHFMLQAGDYLRRVRDDQGDLPTPAALEAEKLAATAGALLERLDSSVASRSGLLV